MRERECTKKFLSHLVMPFGKHHGTRLGDVPADYLLWLYDQDWVKGKWPDIYNYIQTEYRHLEQEVADEKWKRF